MTDFVTMTCPSCGGKLQIGNTIDRFACGYCGSEHVVNRGGGIISLSPVIDEIRKVQSGVDKTASELAIARLTREINEIKAMDARIREIVKYYDRREYDGGSISWVAMMDRTAAFALIEVRRQNPSSFLKVLNGTGFKDSQIQELLYSVTLEDVIAMQGYTEDQITKYVKSPEQMNYETKRMRSDLEKLREMLEAKASLPSKIEELKQHQQIVAR
jgi:hypothetical protein